MSEIQVMIPQTIRDVLPEDAQKAYIEAYTRSWEEYRSERENSTARAAVAARDAWTAVTHEFVRDEGTHQWHRKGEQPEPAAVQQKRSALSFLRGIFRRGQ